MEWYLEFVVVVVVVAEITLSMGCRYAIFYHSWLIFGRDLEFLNCISIHMKNL